MNTDVPQYPLYDPRLEHDACGVGFVADLAGRPGPRIVATALQALGNLIHRGAVDADGKTGDGAGLLLQLPRKLFLKEMEKAGHACPRAADLAAGACFLPREDWLAAAACRELVERKLAEYGLLCFGWRAVPVRSDALGEKAAATAPLIEQVFIGRGQVSPAEYERMLYLVRKEVESARVEGFYIPSLSSQTIVYKGLFAASQLAEFYQDLRDPDFETALAVLHQRYSTNTFPNWFLAQPFRMLAHNGEINTIEGNRNWMRAREADLRASLWGERAAKLMPVIWGAGSDSASLDNALELLTASGRDALHAMMMLMPEAYENHPGMKGDLRGFYDYAACLMEPWDGPAAVAFTDGRVVGAALDRNGLRPARYAVTRDNLFILTSEAGAVDLAPETVIEKGRLGPGKMIAVDTARGLVLTDEQIKLNRARRKPYARWVRRSMIACPQHLLTGSSAAPLHEASLTARMKSFGYTLEDINRIIEPMLVEGKEPVGSMGDDTPLAVLSAKPRLLYGYFKQRFAQVTNPAIDPLRERAVMSLTTLLGGRGNFLEETPAHAQLIKLPGPVLTDACLEWLRERKEAATLAALFDAQEGEQGLKAALDKSPCRGNPCGCPDGAQHHDRHRAGARSGQGQALPLQNSIPQTDLQAALDRLCEQAVAAIDSGYTILILSDRNTDQNHAPVPMLLAVGAVHHHLIRAGKRMRASIVAETGEAREDHHFACLIGYGANAVNPYLAFEVVASEARKRDTISAAATQNYRKAVENGLLKIMAKMGIATVASYCGAQVFEAIGLDRGLVEKYFTGTFSRIGGAGLAEIARDALRFHQSAYADGQHALEDAGYYRYRAGGEFHSFNPGVFRALHRLARSGDRMEYERFAEQVATRQPTTLRDLLEFRARQPIPIEEVEPIESILERICTSGMSLGALSREAHETLAIAMNRIGGRSNSGEGGEDPARYEPYSDGDWANSRIKQVASARFGVTPQYLISADELEIKISQGSKPGEGGQLPGHKVTAEIAALRHSVPGVTLISPPPHHDIYSIEDLAQLIYDLREINPRARIAVKLVSEAGVGTVAAGVVKAHADVIHISGHDGGTGASPLGSIKNAGTPWELGLAETQQILALNGLRERVRLRVDGGLKSGRDVVIAAMLGAEEFGFATSAVVALGCVMARQCHLNTCPVGIATQAPHLRERFAGKPEMVIHFFTSLAADARRILAELGFHSLAEVVGRSDLLAEKAGTQLPRSVRLDLSPILAPSAAVRSSRPTTDNGQRTTDIFNEAILEEVSAAITTGQPVSSVFEIRNTDRAAGARIAGEIARCYGNDGLPDGTIDLTFLGSAGQSFGAFNISGMRLTLVGEANDYVGKGMSGGKIIIHPPVKARFDWSENVILGNTVMYGATGGTLFAAGRAGERFCVRNSGGCAVVEGVGDHGCEYMTAGTVVILGDVGRNFAAGMTGGVAYVLDEAGSFQGNCNRELVALEPIGGEYDTEMLRSLVVRHYELTGSPRAHAVLWSWERHRARFWKVVTQGAVAQMPEREVAVVGA